MIVLVPVYLYFLFLWILMRGKACWLCGALAGEMGCPVCDHTPKEPLV